VKYSENVNAGDIFNAVMVEEKFAYTTELTKTMLTMLNVSILRIYDQQQL